MSEQAGLDALRAMLFGAPATRKVEVTNPKVRDRPCAKCPFEGSDLDEVEQGRAATLRERLAGEPATVWGCHETVEGQRPMVCGASMRWRREQEKDKA